VRVRVRVQAQAQQVNGEVGLPPPSPPTHSHPHLLTLHPTFSVLYIHKWVVERTWNLMGERCLIGTANSIYVFWEGGGGAVRHLEVEGVEGQKKQRVHKLGRFRAGPRTLRRESIFPFFFSFFFLLFFLFLTCMLHIHLSMCG